MKKLILLLSMIVLVGFVNAQNKTDDKKPADTKAKVATTTTVTPSVDVPAPIKTKFTSYYPNVKDAVWKEEKENYVASFEQNKVKTAVVFDGAGNLVETRTDTKVKDLPEKIEAYVKKNMGKSTKIKSATKITDAKGLVVYETLINEKKETFDAKGKYLGENDDK